MPGTAHTKFGPEVKIGAVPHYFVDLREPLTVVNRPTTLMEQALEKAIDNALEIQRRLDTGWRPSQLSFTILELYQLGGYSNVV